MDGEWDLLEGIEHLDTTQMVNENLVGQAMEQGIEFPALHTPTHNRVN